MRCTSGTISPPTVTALRTKGTGEEIKVQIIGLFTPNVTEQFGETVTAYDKIQNRVFVDLQTSKALDGGELNSGFSALHVTIDDPQDTARVVADVKALPGIDWRAFTVEADNETYENAAAPLAALNELVVTLLAVIIAVSAIILALILTLWTRSRIHEIGVFLSVGIGKSAIIGQYLTEDRRPRLWPFLLHRQRRSGADRQSLA